MATLFFFTPNLSIVHRHHSSLSNVATKSVSARSSLTFNSDQSVKNDQFNNSATATVTKESVIKPSKEILTRDRSRCSSKSLVEQPLIDVSRTGLANLYQEASSHCWPLKARKSKVMRTLSPRSKISLSNSVITITLLIGNHPTLLVENLQLYGTNQSCKWFMKEIWERLQLLESTTSMAELARIVRLVGAGDNSYLRTLWTLYVACSLICGKLSHVLATRDCNRTSLRGCACRLIVFLPSALDFDLY